MELQEELHSFKEPSIREDLVHFFEEPASEYNGDKDFVSLRAWQHARKLKLFLPKILPLLPPDERYAMGTQIRRAASSITANIAEGYGRFHYKEGIQFYRIARGSIYELKDFLIACLDLSFIDRAFLIQVGS